LLAPYIACTGGVQLCEDSCCLQAFRDAFGIFFLTDSGSAESDPQKEVDQGLNAIDAAAEVTLLILLHKGWKALRLVVNTLEQ